jgi:two-component system response regulator YesN
MYKLLIVDDEPITVDGLYTLIQDMDVRDLEISVAYTAQEALEYMKRYKVDIILSDVIMPGISGLELQEHVMKQWPECKFIFLTGHDDFSFIQKAVKNDSIDYLLKDGDESKIRDALEKARKKIDEESKITCLLEKSRYLEINVLPNLQRDLVMDILEGNTDVVMKLDEKFKKLDICLNASSKVFIMALRVDSWGEFVSHSDKNTGEFSIRNIVEERLSPMAKILTVNTDRNKILVLIQSAGSVPTTPKIDETEEKRIKLYVNETCSDIQKLIHQHLGITVSFAISKDFIHWNEVSNKYLSLNILMNRDMGYINGSIIIEKEITDENETMIMSQNLQTIKKVVVQMDTCMELSQEKDFFKAMDELRKLCNDKASDTAYLNYMVYYSLLPVLLNHLESVSGEQDAAGFIDVSRLINPNVHPSWDHAIDYLSGTAEKIFEIRRKRSVQYAEKLIIDIQKYINKHIFTDVSLTSLADEFKYNSNYLSQLYKSITGEGISDYTNKIRLSRARQLLKDNDLKISEITEKIGLKTPSYFTRFFKKNTGYTPQEYRNSLNL